MDKYEKAAREWMKGCSNAVRGRPWSCAACSEAYAQHLARLIAEDGDGVAEIPPESNPTNLTDPVHRWFPLW